MKIKSFIYSSHVKYKSLMLSYNLLIYSDDDTDFTHHSIIMPDNFIDEEISYILLIFDTKNIMRYQSKNEIICFQRFFTFILIK